MIHATDLQVLSTTNVTAIINCAESLHSLSYPTELHLKPEDYFFVPAIDDAAFEISTYFSSVHEFIERKIASGQICLIHCHGGRNRSVALAIAHLLLTGSYTLGAAVRLVASQRPMILSNMGFRRALLDFALSLNGSRPDLLFE